MEDLFRNHKFNRGDKVKVAGRDGEHYVFSRIVSDVMPYSMCNYLIGNLEWNDGRILVRRECDMEAIA